MNAEEIYHQLIGNMSRKVPKFRLWTEFMEQKIKEWTIKSYDLETRIIINNSKILDVNDEEESHDFERFLFDHFCVSKSTEKFVLKVENINTDWKDNEYSFILKIYPVVFFKKFNKNI